jgi:Flp pilus assembly protein TadD
MPVVPEERAALLALARVKLRLQSASPLGASANGRISPRRTENLRRHLARGREALEAGNWNDAERHFSAAILLAPDTAEAHAGLGDTYARLGRADDAAREFRAALYSADDPELRLRLARALLAARPPKIEEARSELRRILRLNPTADVRSAARALLEEMEGSAAPPSKP